MIKVRKYILMEKILKIRIYVTPIKFVKTIDLFI